MVRVRNDHDVVLGRERIDADVGDAGRAVQDAHRGDIDTLVVERAERKVAE